MTADSAELQPAFARSLPTWQVRVVLVGFPALYLANSFTPWSIGLFGYGERSWYFPFMISILVLHWATAIYTVGLIYRAGGTLADIGLKLTPRRVAAVLASFIIVGAGLLYLRATWPMPVQPPKDWMNLYPFTWNERVLMLFVSCTAGICEEIIYRGFAIRVLQARGTRTVWAVLIAGISFALIHGLAGVFLLPIYLLSAVIFSAIFLWRGSLLTAIVTHALFDMQMVLAV